MSNYSLVIDSTFKPFSYQELMAPVARMSEYHEKLAQEYDNLSSQADILEAMGNDDRDKNSGVYSRYKSYSDSLRNEADNLYRYGLNVESRRRLSDLRRRYNTEIVPIQNAWNKRDEEAKAQLDASIKNPLLKFSRNAKDTPLEYYINNPQGGYDAYDLKNVYTMTAAMAKTLAKQAREGRKEYIDDVTYRFITPYGLDPNLINDWQSNPDASPTLTNMVSQALASNGITADNPIYNEALSVAKLGTWEAIGEDKEHIQNDQARLLNMQAAKEIGVARAKAAMTAGADNGGYTFSDSMYELPMQGATKDNKATSRNVRVLNYEKGDWNANSRNFMAKEITGYKEGKPIYDSKAVSLGDLLNKQNANKKDINVSSYWSDEEGEEGLILATTEDGKAHRYFISADNMPENNIQVAKEYFNYAKIYKEAGRTAEAAQAIDLAMKALHTGLTTHNKSYEQSVVRQPSLKQQGQVD